VCWSH